MNSKDVSVIITNYNYGHFIQGAVESVLNQHQPAGEIIIVDDGSTDQSRSVIDRYASDPRFKIIYQENQGQTAAKNNGIKNSIGKIIGFLDADDRWRADKLALQVPHFSDPDVGVVFSRQAFIDDKGEFLDPQPEPLPVFRGRVTRQLLRDNFVPFSSALFRRDCADNLGQFDDDLRMGIDWDLWLRYSLYYSFDYVNEPLLFYRVNHEGQMSRRVEARLEAADVIFNRFVRRAGKNIPPSWVREAEAYTLNTRGYEIRFKRPLTSIWLYIQSLVKNPIQWHSWRGLLTQPFIAFFLLFSRVGGPR